MSLRKLYYFLPPAARLIARKVYYMPHDLIQSLSGSDELMPPKGMIYTGGGDFLETGERLLGYFKSYGNLKSDDHVLDIGSGIGRLAIPLTKYLSKEAQYNGFDVMEQGVNWCEENISARHQNFQFHFIKLKNDLYRNEGEQAINYNFPLADGSQDFIFLISVFTHLVPDEMEHYISEISRMLKPGKRCFASFFVLDEDLIEKNSSFEFEFRKGHFALMDEKVVSANVAFEKKYLFEVFQKSNLKIAHYLPGFWREGMDKHVASKNQFLDFQDIIVLEK